MADIFSGAELPKRCPHCDSPSVIAGHDSRFEERITYRCGNWRGVNLAGEYWEPISNAQCDWIKILRRERDEARAEAQRLREALEKINGVVHEGDYPCEHRMPNGEFCNCDEVALWKILETVLQGGNYE